MKKAISIIAVIIIAVLWYVLQIQQNDAVRKQYATRFSNKTAGASVFYNLAEGIHPGGVHLGLKPLFDDTELRNSSVYIMLEPLKSLSDRELNVIADFVSRGGTAIFSFRDVEESHLGYKLVGTIRMRDNLNYKNYQPTDVNVSYGESTFFPKGKYAFYSNKIFDDANCNDYSLGCFVKINSYGSGQVILFSGIPILANGLIGMADNRLFAYKIIDENITLDEYHHNYDAKTFIDLLFTPSVSLPIFGALIIGILFFLFGTNSLQEKVDEEEKHLSAHDLRLGILQNILTKRGLSPGTVEKLASYVEKLCPTKKEEINQIVEDAVINKKGAISYFKALTALHKDFLLERGE